MKKLLRNVAKLCGPKFFIGAQYFFQLMKFIYSSINFKLNNASHAPVFFLWPRSIRFRSEGDTSQFGQSSLIDVLLDKKKNGTFVDIGANHPTFNSNSNFFEHERGYSGYSFEPLPSYKEIYPKFRPNTKFYSYAVGAKEETLILRVNEVTEGWEDQLSTLSVSNDDKGSVGLSVKVAPLTFFDINRDVDFISIDVEGFELNVLSGINWGEIKPSIVCIENCESSIGSNVIRDILISAGYLYFARIKYIDDIFVKNELSKEFINNFNDDNFIKKAFYKF